METITVSNELELCCEKNGFRKSDVRGCCDSWIMADAVARWGLPVFCCHVFKRQYGSRLYIRITCPCNVYPLTPHFYIVKLGFVGVYILSYFCSKT